MPFLIGTDEAGYGPNLGPLVITGTLWEVPDIDVDLYQVLEQAVSQSRCKGKLTVCDSKSIYSSGGSIARLETSVLSMLDTLPSDLTELTRSLGCKLGRSSIDPWLVDRKLSLPIKADRKSIESGRTTFANTCSGQQVKLLAMRSVTVFANEFNQGVEQLGNKASVLTSETLNLVRELLALTDGDVHVVCDKHGGRAKYVGAIQHHLTDQLISVHRETLESSRYEFRRGQQLVEMEFRAKGESSMPVALASMVSKYLRELYMMLWNRFWLSHLPTLRPTKGYPQDAKRFMFDIEAVRSRLNISRESLWRCR